VSEIEAGGVSHRAEPRPLALVADDETEMRRPQLIVADVMMPGMDGYTAVAHLRGQSATAGIPIIMLTGCTDPAYGQLSEGMGASAHVTKPFSPLLLGELAQEMVRRSRV
jgi:CheY-like chemotaxis protein